MMSEQQSVSDVLKRSVQIDVPSVGCISFVPEPVTGREGGFLLRPCNVPPRSNRSRPEGWSRQRKMILRQKIVILDSFQIELLKRLKSDNSDGIGFLNLKDLLKSGRLQSNAKSTEQQEGSSRRNLMDDSESGDTFGLEDPKGLVVKRFIVCECANPKEEYAPTPSRGGRVTDGLTYTVLVEYEQEVTNRDVRLRETPGSEPQKLVQDNNGLISSGDPNSKPPPPIAANAWGVETEDAQSDFSSVTQQDENFYQKAAQSGKNKVVVAIVDTGLKFNLHDPAAPYTYVDHTGKQREFMIAYQEGIAGLPNSRIGYCAIARYKQPGFVEKKLSPATGSLTAGQIAQGQELFRNSPYDDHRMFASGGAGEMLTGRHGTTIGAIINQQAGVPVLPVKAFDHGGYGTLFDVLCALNYVLERHKSETIRVLNASWIFKFDSPLLRSKIEQLNRAGIILVAAAGNTSQVKSPDLSGNNSQTGESNQVYPACYSNTLPNVITVTTVGHTLVFKPAGKASPPVHEKPQDDLITRIPVSELGRKLGVTQGHDLTLGPLVPYENYSDEYVTVGVISSFGRFPSPFQPQKSSIHTTISGSSFATAIVSAKVACYLRRHLVNEALTADTMAALRQQIIDAISVSDPALNGKIKGARVVMSTDSDCVDSFTM